VDVTVAQPMSDQEREELSKELAEAMNAKIDLDIHVDAALLGGMVIRYATRWSTTPSRQAGPHRPPVAEPPKEAK